MSELLRYVASAGARFTLVAHRGKHPVMSRHGTVETPSYMWEYSPYTLDEALQWRGNVGILTGDYSSGIGAIDADADAASYLEAWPKLQDAVRIYRHDNAGRVKWLVRSPPGYASRGNWLADIDMIFNYGAGGQNAVIAGVHMFGAPLLWDGISIPEFTAEELDNVYRWRLDACLKVMTVRRETMDSFTRFGTEDTTQLQFCSR